jgi:hypothetical protein
MDVDPTPATAINNPVVVPEAPSSVVCLPYSLVPGLDMSSRSYQRAVTTLAKQQPTPAPVTAKAPLVSVLDRGMQHFPHPSLQLFK